MSGPGIPAEADVASKGQGPRRSGRARTTRVRDDFIDADFLQYVAPCDEPMAFAEEEPPKKSPTPKGPAPKAPSTRIGYDEADDRPVGPDYQATIPACRPRPAQPTATEAKFLPAAPLYTPAHVLPSDKGSAVSAAAFRAKYKAAPSSAARCKLLEGAVQGLDQQMGPHMVKVLHLDMLGAKRGSTWQPHEELLFCLGMCDKYRMFKYIRQCYLWSRSAHELNGYYHNVWKTRSTTEADEFLTLREQRASAPQMLEFVDKVRDKLTAMWDRKKMGDMPKLLKDAAAAAAAGAQLQELLAAEASAEEAISDPEASSGTASDDSSSQQRPPPSRPKPRKRAAATQHAAGSRERAQVHVQPVKQEVLPSPEALPTPTGTPALQQWLQPDQASSRPAAAVPARQPVQQQRRGQQVAKQQRQAVQEQQQQFKRPRQQQQQQQQAAAVVVQLAARNDNLPGQAAVAGVAGLGSASHSLPPTPAFPEMPLLPEPDASDPVACEQWVKAVPAYRAAMADYMQAVHGITDTAVASYQRSIDELQEQRARLTAQADAYLRSLLAQGHQLMQNIGAHVAKQQQPVPPMPSQQPPQQPHQQQPKPVPEPARKAGDLQSAVQQLLLSHAKQRKRQHCQQLQQSVSVPAVQVPQAAAAAAGGPVQPQPEPAQPSPLSAVPSCEAAAALPFPALAVGPAAKWLSMQGGAAAQLPTRDEPKRFKVGLTAGGGDDAAGDALAGGGSSSEDCEMYVATTAV